MATQLAQRLASPATDAPDGIQSPEGGDWKPRRPMVA